MEVIGKMDLPFEQKDVSNEIKIRTFSSNTDIGEFTWHRDREDRVVELIEGENWHVQLDNELPTSLNQPIFIERHQWHRVIKGDGNLRLKIHLK